MHRRRCGSDHAIDFQLDLAKSCDQTIYGEYEMDHDLVLHTYTVIFNIRSTSSVN